MYLFSTDLPHGKSLIHDRRREQHWKLYGQHLKAISNKLRPATRAFALAEWHYDPTDPRCPHDAWLEATTLSETVTSDDAQRRQLAVKIRLLGAYHDGHIELTYDGVIGYCLDFPPVDLCREANRGHGDWLVDEVRFSDRGKVLHEIEWANGARWYIECDDVHYAWIPMDDPSASEGAA
jgi:hypothetical protein